MKGFKTIKEILKTGTATVQYPFKPLELPEHYRGKPEHDIPNCIACAACALACPPNAIQMQLDLNEGYTTWSINYGRCIFCGRCEEVCPTKAIKLSSEFELAVFAKDDLEEQVHYPLLKCDECGEYYASAKEVDYAERILKQSAEAGGEVTMALDDIHICPKCKQKKDSYRARARVDASGDPTPDPSPEALYEAKIKAMRRHQEEGGMGR